MCVCVCVYMCVCVCVCLCKVSSQCLCVEFCHAHSLPEGSMVQASCLMTSAVYGIVPHSG